MSASKAAKTIRPRRPAVADDPKRYYTYWLTRDADPETGKASEVVDVWYQRPIRYSLGDLGWFWIADAGMADHFGRWTVQQAVAACGTAPDDSRQCICVGPPEHARAKIPEES